VEGAPKDEAEKAEAAEVLPQKVEEAPKAEEAKRAWQKERVIVQVPSQPWPTDDDTTASEEA
jgi:hypothetical protein